MKKILSVIIVLILAVSIYQALVIENQRVLIRQMMTNRDCIMPEQPQVDIREQ